MFKLSKRTIEKLDELYELENKYPLTIPVPVVAKFLGMDDSSLRACILHGNCPFALGWKKPGKENSAYTIPTQVFIGWYAKDFLRVKMAFRIKRA